MSLGISAGLSLEMEFYAVVLEALISALADALLAFTTMGKGS